VALLAVMSNRAFFLSVWSWDVLYLGPALMIIWGLAVAPAARPARLLSSRSIVKLGEASFAFYLIHLPAIEILHASWAGKLTVSSVALQAVYLTIILSVALGIHMLIEVPCRNLVRRFTQATVGNSTGGRAENVPHPVVLNVGSGKSLAGDEVDISFGHQA
jgi:peptidoglycan/LPS O-acetylase OafA/YrhL